MSASLAELQALRRALATSGELTPSAAVAAVRATAPDLQGRELLSAADDLHRAVAGAGVLDPLLRDPEITDVLVNGPDQIWIDRGRGLQPSEVRFPDAAELRRLALRLAAAGGHRLDDARPFADVRLPGGIRAHVMLPPLTPSGVHLSIRIPSRRGFGVADLVAAGALPPGGADLLRRLVAARSSFLVTGGTGTGKTTVLGALLGLAGPEERIVVVEDFAELRPEHPHVVHLQARPPNAEGAGDIGVGELVRQALRMRPDRLVVGEARGGEITDLLTALNTGHTGGCGTIHVDRPDQLPARVEAMAALRGWPPVASRRQLAAAVGAVIHLGRSVDGRRIVRGIARVRLQGDEVSVCPAYRFTTSGVVAEPAAEQWPALTGSRPP
jgi:pilus assembly protein CpaF